MSSFSGTVYPGGMGQRPWWGTLALLSLGLVGAWWMWERFDSGRTADQHGVPTATRTPSPALAGVAAGSTPESAPTDAGPAEATPLQALRPASTSSASGGVTGGGFATAAAIALAGPDADRLAEAQQLESDGFTESAWAAYAQLAGWAPATATPLSPTPGPALRNSTTPASTAVGVVSRTPSPIPPDVPPPASPPANAASSEAGRLAAAVELARLALAKGEPGTAMAVLEAAMNVSPDAMRPTPSAQRATPGTRSLGDRLPSAGWYLYGRALAETDRPAEAVEAYRRYGAAVPEMADVAAMAIGSAEFELGRFEAALRSFTEARDKAPDAGTGFLAALRRGNALLRTGPTAMGETAELAYEDAYRRAVDDGQKAQALAGMIGARSEAGDAAGVIALRRRLVRELPGTELARRALENLKAAGEIVPPAELAAVREGAGDRAGAVELWGAVVTPGSSAPSPEAELAILRNLLAMGDPAGVVEKADAFLGRSPADYFAAEAAWLRAQALVKLDRLGEAAKAYGALADRWPDGAGTGDQHADRAAAALWQQAWLVEPLEGPVASASIFEALASRYPADGEAAEARFRAGFLLWRAGRLPLAAERWSVLAEHGAAADRARAEYWLGRAAKDAGNAAVAQAHWEAAATADPFNYYGLRAAERLGRLSGPSNPDASGDAIGPWLASWGAVGGAADWRAIQASLLARSEVRRAAAWLAVGERSAAQRTLRSLNTALANRPAERTALALEADRLGLHDPAMAAATNALAAAPAGAKASAPLAFRRLLYPEAWGDLVRREAAANAVPASLLFAVLRQESRFEPTARSSAGARGLAQVMPATGEGLAKDLGETGFSAADLDRPYLAIRFGAVFLARQLQAFGNHPWMALSAYNGGPANARRWQRAAGDDQDVFVESIDFRETRKYVRLVLEHEAQYRLFQP